MHSKNITFDKDSGVPYGLNLTMYGGSDFEVTLNVKTTSSSAFDLTNYSGTGPCLRVLQWSNTWNYLSIYCWIY